MRLRKLLTCPLPVVGQFLSVKAVPFQHCVQRTARKLARHHSCLNVDRDFVLSIFCMEMRRWMFTVIEIDDDSQKTADFGHDEIISA